MDLGDIGKVADLVGLDIGELIAVAKRMDDLMDEVDDLDPVASAGAARAIYQAHRTSPVVAATAIRIGSVDYVLLASPVRTRVPGPGRRPK